MKRFFSLLLIAILLAQIPLTVYGHKKGKHDQLLTMVLFGSENSPRLISADAQNALKALEAASYLALDQFNGNGVEQLKILTDYKVRDIPKTIEEIDFSGNFSHRSYTHRGWNYIYSDDKAKWPIRKQILLSTTEKVFDFQSSFSEWIGNEYNEKCDSLAALIYYVHVLGDQEARSSYKAKELMMPFARPHASEENPDIFMELKYHLSILFKDQKTKRKFKSLMRELDKLAEDARALEGATGGVNSEEKFQELHKIIEDVFETLEIYVPKLLAKEKFFKETFPLAGAQDAA